MGEVINLTRQTGDSVDAAFRAVEHAIADARAELERLAAMVDAIRSGWEDEQ